MSNSSNPTDAAAALAGTPYFRELSDTTMQAVARAASLQTHEADEVIFIEGAPCAGLYVVQSGWLKAIRSSPAGREQVLRYLGPGEVVNVTSVFAELPNAATLIVLEPSTVWRIEPQAMLRLLEREPTLARRVIRVLSRRMLHLADLVEDLSLRTVEARLARMLLEEAQEGALHRRRWATQAELATRLGTVSDVLHRALRGMEDEGLVAVDRQAIRILDRQGLERRAMMEE